jgi:hypothetical protein
MEISAKIGSADLTAGSAVKANGIELTSLIGIPPERAVGGEQSASFGDGVT